MSRGGDISIFQDTSKTLYISYYDFNLNYLKLAICKDSNCNENKTIIKLIEAKILPGLFYSWNSLIVNNFTKPHFSTRKKLDILRNTGIGSANKITFKFYYFLSIALNVNQFCKNQF